jgi:hypothetical protein
MRKRLFLWAFCCLSAIIASAQDSTIFIRNMQLQDSIMKSKAVRCPVSADFLASLEASPEGVTTIAGARPKSSFPETAIRHCGKIDVYYEDIALHTGVGFDKTGAGTTRINTFCDVLTYIQSVFDFSLVSATNPVRIYMYSSYEGSGPYAAPTGTTWLGQSSPVYSFSPPISPFSGYMRDYIVGGSDLNPAGYHAEIRMNFDRYYAPSGPVPIVYHETDATDVDNCEWDLFSTLLHETGHCMGWFSNLSFSTGGPSSLTYTVGGSRYTHLDNSIHATTRIGTSPNPFGSMTKVVSSTIGGTFVDPAFWLNNQAPPNNYAVAMNAAPSFDHLDIARDAWTSPGDWQPYVMQGLAILATQQRQFAKAEIKTFHDVMGYTYKSSFSTAVPGTYTVNNHLPYSTKMTSDYYNEKLNSWPWYWDEVDPDYTMTNDIGSSLVINLATDRTLVDADGDPISVMPGSLVNLRGCGNGGNNHNLLTLSAGNTVITYTPRHNFYGRANFAFNLWDGKEKGAYVVVTIDVAKGTNVSAAVGDNLVLNGDFEEGTEIKRLGADENIPNSAAWEGHYGRLNAFYSADAHPHDHLSDFYTYGVCVKNSYSACSTATIVPYEFGTTANTVPGATYTGLSLPNPPGGGERYHGISGTIGGYFNLAESLQHCHRYTLEFDAYRLPIIGGPGPTTETVEVRFMESSVAAYRGGGLTWSHLMGATGPFTFSPSPAGSIGSSWGHISIPFYYCGETGSDLLAMRMMSPNTLLIDNVSIKEGGSSSVSLTADNSEHPCQRVKLTATINNPALYTCHAPIYSWKADGVPIAGATTASIYVSPDHTTTYEVTVNYGCNDILTSTITVPGLPVYGATATVLSSPVSVSPPAGYYYVESDLTITNNTTFASSLIMVAPNVKITVADNRKLTLNNTHVFTCPTAGVMWKGFELQRTSGNGGKIELTNNSMVEDAITAITANNPATTSGNIITCADAVFNRNRTGVQISNYTASSPSVYPFSFTNTVFTARALNVFTGYPISWPSAASLRYFKTGFTGATPPVVIEDYAEAVCKNGITAFAGIRLSNIGYTAGSSYAEIQIGDRTDTAKRNLFDNIGDGIIATSANLTCYNNTFMRLKRSLIVADPTGPTPPSGVGVNVNGNYSTLPARVRLMPATTPQSFTNNRFYDCQTALNSVNYWETISQGSLVQTSNTSYAASNMGLYATSNKYANITFQDNNIYNVATGISVFSASGVAGATIGNCLIKTNNILAHPLSPVSFNSAHSIKQAVSVTASAISTPGTVSTTVTIDQNVIADAYNGIAVSYLVKQQAITTNNNVSLVRNSYVSSTTPQYGISYTSSLNGLVKSNNVTTVSSGGTSAGDDNVRGYYFSANTGTLIQCNTATNVGRGYDFTGTQPLTQWLGNTMNGNRKGFALGGPIGAQGSSSSGCYAQWLLPGGWSSVGGRYQTFATVSSTTSPLYVTNFTTSSYTNRPTINASFPSGNEYSLSSPTFSLKNASAFSLNPCNTIIVGLPRSSSIIPTTIANTLEFGRDEAISSWMAQYSLWKAVNIDSALNDTLAAELNSFKLAGAGTRYEWLTELENALADGDTSTAQSLLNSPVAAAGRVVIDTSLVITDTVDADGIVSNYISFYNLYLDYIKGDSVDSAALAALCWLCPLSNGEVVYQARALYSNLYNYYENYDDDSLCGFGSGLRTIAHIDNSSQHYTLYPNPSDGKFSIRQTAIENGSAKVQVYNLTGRLIYRNTVDFSSGLAQINIGDAPAGLYLLQLTDAKGRNFIMKFNIR